MTPTPSPARLAAAAALALLVAAAVLALGFAAMPEGAFAQAAVTPAAGAPAPDVPDPALTPGVADPAVTPATIAATICRPGYTAEARPPAPYTDRLKRQQLAARGYADQNPADYEEDHFLPIEDGGSPTDPRNLWPEHYAGPWGARVKDRVETRLHRLICAGRITLSDAQAALRGDWRQAYKRWVDGE